MDGSTPEPLRVRRRRLVQAEIERVAIRLFLEHGYDAVSVEDIAAQAGMSWRTFFRYYATKDEILRRYQSEVDEVPDPYYDGDQGFEQVLDLIERASDLLVIELKGRL